MVCPYCGSHTEIASSDEAVVETDFRAMLGQLEADAEMEEVASVRCGSCGAEVEPPPSAEAFPCPYCGSSIVAIATSRRLIKPRALLPFHVTRERATELFREWVLGLWLAPNELRRMARLEGHLHGLYAPYWTYDSSTTTRYTGLRGEDRQVRHTRTVTRDGKQVTETYYETVTDWYPAAGTVARDFDDVLVLGSRSLPGKLASELEPWDLQDLVPYAAEYLSGFRAERYQVDLPTGWADAQAIMKDVIEDDAREDIGGDHQTIHTLDTRHDDITFKHILLPLWICSYRYGDRVFRFMVNARTGEIQGERPWSWVKIGLLVLLALAGIAVMAYAN